MGEENVEGKRYLLKLQLIDVIAMYGVEEE